MRELMEAMAQEILPVSDEQLSTVSSLARRALALQNTIESLEKSLKTLAKELREVEEKELPQAIAACGLTDFTLATGEKIEVKPFYSASIPKDDPGPALEWLEQHGFGDLIKHQIGVSLGKGDNETAEWIAKTLRQGGVDFSDTMGVHPQTLRAWVREQVEKGTEVPEKLFNVYIGQRARIRK